MKPSTAVRVLVVLSLIGIGFAFYLTRMHYNALLPGYEMNAICNVNAVINCDTVNQSAYSHIGKIPVAGLGLLYYISILGIALINLSRKQNTPSSSLALALVMSITSLFVSVFLAYQSLQLGALCLFCIGMYIVNICILGSLIAALRTPTQSLGETLSSNLCTFSKTIPAGIAVLAVFGLGLLTFSNVSKQIDARLALVETQTTHANHGHNLNYSESDIAAIVKIHFDQQPITLDIPASRPRGGLADTPLQLVEFVDFQCPACREAVERIPAFMNAHFSGQYSIRTLNYPLSSDCNTNIKRNMHAFACEAAKTSVCLTKLNGDAASFEELAFTRQSEINSKNLRDWATELGTDGAALDACVKDPQTQAWIAEDIALGNQIPVEGTPTILLNGRNLRNAWREPEIFKAILDEALKRSETK